MSITTIFNFETPTDYVYDSEKIEIFAGKARLKLNPITEDFIEDFANDTGFVYDSDLAEFIGGQLRQKDQRPASATFGVTFTNNINGNWGGGVLIGTAVGGAIVSGGKLDLAGGTQKYVDYDADLNADSQQTGCIRFKYTPNYSGTPSTDMNMFCISATTENDVNSIAIRHNSITGNIFLRTCDQNGNYINANVQIGAWSPVSGTEYEIEFNYDFTTGASRIFINGVQIGSTQTATGIRSSAITKLRIGCFNIAGAYVSNFKIDDFEIFSTVQHAANYTPGYIVPETIYASDIIMCPEMEYTGAGTLQAVTDFTTEDANFPRYTLQIGRSGNYLYWDGAAWVNSDNTFAQANTETDFAAHVAELDIIGNIYGQFRVYFNAGSSQQSISNMNIEVTGQQYPTDSPTIDIIDSIRNDGLKSITETIGGTGTVKYLLKKDSLWYYYNGSAWAVSDGTVLQSNTLAEINANKATFAIIPNDLYIRIFLTSNGTQQAYIDTLTVLTDFTPVVPTIQTVIVYLYEKNTIDENDNSLPVSCSLNKAVIKYKSDVLINGAVKKYTPVDGYIEMELVETTNMEAGSYYIFNIGGSIYKKTIPSTLTAVSLLDLPDYE